MSNETSPWGAIPAERRTRWCRTFLDFPPAWPGVVPMVSTNDAVIAGGYSTIHSFAETAIAFEAVGFTPELFYLLRLTLPWETDSPKVIAYGGDTHPKILSIAPSDWAEWPKLIEAPAMTPKRATRYILSDGVLGSGFLADAG